MIKKYRLKPRTDNRLNAYRIAQGYAGAILKGVCDGGWEPSKDRGYSPAKRKQIIESMRKIALKLLQDRSVKCK